MQILFAHDPSYPLLQLEDELDQLLTVPTRGTRLMIRIEQRAYEEVLKATPDPIGIDALELEDASRAHAMIGIAALNLDRPHLALEHLRAAITLGRALGTRRRVQAMQFDWHRAREHIGDLDLPSLDALMMQPDLSDRTQRWAQRLRAQALLELGAPEDALRSLGMPTLDGPQDAAQREFLHALMHLPPARLADDPLIDPALPYHRLAEAYREAKQCAGVKLRDLRGRPFEGYARIIEGRSLLNVKGMSDTVLAILGPTRPNTPAQAVLWSVYRAVAALEDRQAKSAHQALVELSGAMMRLRHAGFVADEVLRTDPALYVTMALGPFSEVFTGLAQLPLLVGQAVIEGPHRIKLPGRTGRALVLEGARHKEKIEISRSEKGRLLEALRGFPGVVNIGVSLRYAELLHGGAVEDGHPSAAAWAKTYRHLWGLLTPDAQSVFANELENSYSEM
ncbi:hypothetical protein GCM10010844_39490 [Deinococcus radiotolerans]|uniref:Uncharacterized protein n=1 Tax=Deinococcus radiotolerans TaxID=1309407 RepID=A0ABQ2FQE3_9DEIO|nr:hypothetical protein GCM10010844_39490 [Deinococcus radiotolerans]